ncbi:ChrR family anti-sigma-E factor [Martelella endophytica]|uniref:Transcriptional regulator n=1 Tax=Martelella endophytica TaxID=1486262 RepID=A0A0D5LRL4_MAREN|nr:ChrR family anti-sigma-E factor [Martelella endophytica]AJY46585.1 transcriptional regulator [Martelella endophytica]
MTVSARHHVSDDLLLEYAAGSLSEGWSLAVATHLAYCPDCRKRLSMMEAAGGALLEDIKTDEADVDDAWATMLGRLDSDDTEDREPVAAVPADAKADVPEPLRSYLGGALSDVRWKRLGVGAHQYLVPTGDTAVTARLLRVPAGSPLPEHSHGGRELTLVLTGSFVSEGETYAPGDLEEEDDETLHQPVVTPDAECICLTVTDAPLRFSSRLMRIVQPFLGI